MTLLEPSARQKGALNQNFFGADFCQKGALNWCALNRVYEVDEKSQEGFSLRFNRVSHIFTCLFR